MKNWSFITQCSTFTSSEELVKFTQRSNVALCLREWHRGDSDSLWMNGQRRLKMLTHTGGCLLLLFMSSCCFPKQVTPVYTPLKLDRSSSLWWWSMTSAMLSVFSQCASWSPALTSSVKVLIDAIVNKTRAVTKRLLIIIFTNLSILNFGPVSVIVVCFDGGSFNVAVQTDWAQIMKLEPPTGKKGQRLTYFLKNLFTSKWGPFFTITQQSATVPCSCKSVYVPTS